MESLDFLTAVLPSTGKYCTFTMRDKLRKNIFVDDLQNLYETNLRLSEKGQNTFYALSAFDDAGTREADHAQAVRALFVDMDCGAGKAYASKKEAIIALHGFLSATGLSALGEPWLVDSGGGVHVYWPLQEEVSIDAWRPVAEALKRAAKQHDLRIDMTVTADAARVLRMPGTLNWKYNPPKPVTLRMRGATFDFEALRETLAGYSAPPAKPPASALVIPGERPSTALTPISRAMMGNTATYFKNIVVKTVTGKGCGQLQYYMDNASADGMEPLWRGLLSWAKVCDDGDKAARKLSAMHPYDEDRMLQKLAEIKGPYACVKMDSENPGICGSCQHWGKITNGLALGREVVTYTEASEVEIPSGNDEEPPVTIMRPTPPQGFEYGRTGGVYYRKPAESEDEQDRVLMVVPYDFFMTRMFRDGSNYQAEFKVIKAGNTTTFAVPTKDITSMKDCIKTLAVNNVIASNPGMDTYLYQYTRQSMLSASAEGREVVVPPRYGWQADGCFAYNQTVFNSRSPEYDYNFVSDRLANIMSATTSAGTLDNWRKVIEMLRMKAANDPMLWGHITVAMSGLGSILMHFAPHGARASVLHLCSRESSAGKSLAQSLAVSAWGETNKYLVAPSTSERTMMQRAGLLGSLPLCIDEITSKNRELSREWLPTFIFDFATGMHKIKGSAAANAEVQHEMVWSSIAIITSNTPGLEAMMGARNHSSEGEARRHLEWYIRDGYQLRWTPQERAVLSLLAENYGHAGPKLAAWCARNQDTVREVWYAIYDHWQQRAGAKDDERFWTATAVSIITAVLLCSGKYAGIVDIPVPPIVDFLISLVARQRRVIATNQRSAIDMLNAYTAENIGNFVKTEGSVVMQNLVGGAAVQPSSARFNIKGRVEYNVTPGHVDYYIETRLLKLHCADNSMGYESFLQELEKAATVQFVHKNLLAGTKGPSMRVACVKITRSIEDVEADER